MKLMSFSLTTAAYEARTKTVTRRMGWQNLKEGEVVMGVVKGMGLKRGEKVQRLHPFRVIKVNREVLEDIKDYPESETAREGFPDLTADEFVRMFMRHNRCEWYRRITRIEFEHLPLSAISAPSVVKNPVPVS